MSTVSIDNFDEVKLALRQELSRLSDKLEKSLRSTDNDPLKINTIRELLGLIKLVTQIFNDIKFAPTIENHHNYNIPDIIVPEIKVPDIHVPEMKAPIVNVAAPQVTVKPTDVIIDFEKLRDIFAPIQDLLEQIGNINTAIGNIPKHQDTFLESLAKESNRNLTNLSAVFSGGQSGMTIDEYKAYLRTVSDSNLILKTTPDSYTVKIAYVSAGKPQYIGKATPGSATSAAVWQISKLTYSSDDVTDVQWAGGSNAFTSIWDNRASLSYS